MGKVIAFKPKCLENEHTLPKAILMGEQNATAYVEYILIGGSEDHDVQIINCDFDKVCDSIEFLIAEADKAQRDSYNVLDLQRWNLLKSKITEVLIGKHEATRRW